MFTPFLKKLAEQAKSRLTQFTLHSFVSSQKYSNQNIKLINEGMKMITGPRVLGLGLAGSAMSAAAFGVSSTKEPAYAMTSKESASDKDDFSKELAQTKNGKSFTVEDFSRSVLNNDINRVQAYLDDETFDLQVNANQSLKDAVMNGHNEIARAFIESKRFSEYFIQNELCKMALRFGNTDIADKIIGNPNTRPHPREYAELLEAAAMSNDTSVLSFASQILFKNPAECNGPIRVAAENGNLEMMKFIFEQGSPNYLGAVNGAIEKNQLDAFILLMGRVPEKNKDSFSFPLNLILQSIVKFNRPQMLEVFYKFKASQKYGQNYCNIMFTLCDTPVDVFKVMVETGNIDPKLGLSTAVKFNYEKLDYIMGLDCVEENDLYSAAQECLSISQNQDGKYIAPMSYSRLLTSDKICFERLPQMDFNAIEKLDLKVLAVTRKNIERALKVHAESKQGSEWLTRVSQKLEELQIKNDKKPVCRL